MEYAELQVTSNFSFLRGASHPAELMAVAKALGLKALAITDHNTFAGVVRGHVAAQEHGLQYIPAVRLDLMRDTTIPTPEMLPDGISLLAYPKDREAYSRLTELLTIGNRRAGKGACHIWLADVAAFSKGSLFVLLPERVDEQLDVAIPYFRERLAAPLFLGTSCQYQGNDKRRVAWLAKVAAHTGVRLVATNDVKYHALSRRKIMDTLACVRASVSIDEAGYLLKANAERFLKPPCEMARLFDGYEDSLKATVEITEECRFSLEQLQYNYPHEPVPTGRKPQEHLAVIARMGLKERFPDGVPEKLTNTLEHELQVVGRMEYAPYFLTVHDIVSYARKRGILCQGRGSAANSIICFALKITDVNPTEVELLFERFVSDARKEPPDIDVDFEHERREEVIQYIYRRYGRHRAGLAATLVTYRMRSAVRDVGKVMGLSADTISALAGTVWGSYGREITEEHVKEAGFDPRDERLRQTLSIAHELIGFPRHLSQHVGGFVLTETPLHEVVPIQNAAMKDRTVIEWSKDDLDALCILKVDVLALGMLSCLQKAFNLIKQHHRKSYDIHSLPKEDKATYEMMHTADTIGVFQIESRAQMSMLPRLKPKEFYDLVVQVAIVRPGPIQGDMVHPYLKRRQGKEDVTFPGPHPAHGPADELKEVLHKTYGVPLFQEQAMRIAIVAAGFAPEEADQLRRSMASFRNHGTIHKFEEKFITGMTKRGYEEDYAHRCFKQIGGFADYGFPESHAAAFAMLAYASAWIKCHYPHVFTCALLNSQPMGFYAASQLVRDAHEHGVEVRAVDINHSQWDCTLEPAPENVWKYALRLGFRQAKGFRVSDAEKLLAARYRPFDDVEDIHRRARLPVAQLERLAEADCFRSCSLDRRAALWQVRGLADTADLPLFQHAGETERGREAPVSLPEMQLSEHVAHDYQALRLSLKAHPVAFMRDTFTERGVVSNRALEGMPNGSQVAVSGLVLVRQRPGSSKGVVFLTLEDETGVANIVVWGKVFDQYRKDVMGSRLLIVHGKLQHEDNVIHVVARHLENVSMELAKMVDGVETSTLDKERISIQPLETSHHQMQGLIPKSRDFH